MSGARHAGPGRHGRPSAGPAEAGAYLRHGGGPPLPSQQGAGGAPAQLPPGPGPVCAPHAVAARRSWAPLPSPSPALGCLCCACSSLRLVFCGLTRTRSASFEIPVRLSTEARGVWGSRTQARPTSEAPALGSLGLSDPASPAAQRALGQKPGAGSAGPQACPAGMGLSGCDDG